MCYHFKVDYDMIMLIGTDGPPAISLHTGQLDTPCHLSESSLIKQKEYWPKLRRPRSEVWFVFCFISYFYSLFLSPSLFYIPLWPYFSLLLPLPSALMQGYGGRGDP